MSAEHLHLNWEVREPPLEPSLALATGDAAVALFLRLQREPANGLGALAAWWGGNTPNERFLLVGGPQRALPWVDGVRYLGEASPGFLLPTTHRPQVPDAWVFSALRRRFSHLAPPLALLTPNGPVVSLADAIPLSHAGLQDAAVSWGLQSNSSPGPDP